MSLRNVRKMFGTTNPLPPLEGNSDEEFEPLYSKDKTSKSTFAGLELSSHSESDREITDNEEVVQIKDKKKKKKNKKKKQSKVETDDDDTNNDKMDEIDRSLMEVNALLGAPPPASSSSADAKKLDPVKVLLSVQAKNLDFNNELKRLFGSDCLDDTKRGKKYKPHNVVKYRRAAIVPIPENKQYHTVGLSMALERKENGYSYFTFNHNKDYQKMHHHFQEIIRENDVIPIHDTQGNMHIEGLLNSVDIMFRGEGYTEANNLLETIISYLHYVAHPSFNLTDQTVRLEYKYVENRPFFIAVLKYAHMLTNKALHRTALELAKLLLNLDPTDPLAIIYVIDVMALRAREHQWLVDVIEHWTKERDAGYLFNMQYSNAMAHFHIAKKNKTNDYKLADELLQEAMLLYPTVATRIFENCKSDSSMRLQKHPYFNIAAEDKYYTRIKTAMILHAKLVCWRWREPAVAKWFFRNADEVMSKLDNDPLTKKRAEDLSLKRRHFLGACPDEIYRHLHVVHSMTNLLVEWELPHMSNQRSWDPLPPANGIDRYGSNTEHNANSTYTLDVMSIFSGFAAWYDGIGVYPDESDSEEE